MRPPRLQLVAVVLTTALPLAAAAQTPRHQPFELQQAQGWAQALALCDLTRFLLIRPDLNADVILARDDPGGWLKPMYGPRFLPPAIFFDGRVRRAASRLEKAGELERRDFAEARASYDRPMMQALGRNTAVDQRFLETQADVCSVLEDDIRKRYP